MKARFVHQDGVVYLETCTGTRTAVSNSEIRAFLETYDDESHYLIGKKQTAVTTLLDAYEGELLAYVDDDFDLTFVSADFFRRMYATESKLLSAVEYGKLHGKQSGIIRRMCRDGRMPGAIIKNGTWLIPADAPYPVESKSNK